MRSLSTGFLAFTVYVLSPVLAIGQPRVPPGPGGESDLNPEPHVVARLLQQHIPPSLEVDRSIAGLSAGRHPELLTWERVYEMSLVRARGAPGPRAETLDPKAIAEQAARCGFADFGRFREEFLAARRPGGGAFRDPSGDFLELLEGLEKVYHARRHTAFYKSAFVFLSELHKGEHAGLSRLALDQVENAMDLARLNLAEATADYRDRLEGFKVAMGLSVHAPVVLDQGIMASFSRVFDQARGWQERPDRSLQELSRIIKGLPALGNVVVEGRSILSLMGGSTDQQEEAMGHAARVAIRNRRDLDKGQAHEETAVALELEIRRGLRRLSVLRRAYELQQRGYELSILRFDNELIQMAAPSGGSELVPSALVRSAKLGTGIIGLLAPETQRREAEDRLVTIWTSFQRERLAIYRELGIFPYDDWRSFFNDLSAR